MLTMMNPKPSAREASVTHVEKLRGLLDLKKGWDSYNAREISLYAVERAQQFIEALHIVPTVRGGVQLEWHHSGVEIEIEFAADGRVVTCSMGRETR